MRRRWPALKRQFSIWNLRHAWERVKANRGGVEFVLAHPDPQAVETVLGKDRSVWGAGNLLGGNIKCRSHPLARALATQTGMTNRWLASQGLLSVRDLWMKAHGYA